MREAGTSPPYLDDLRVYEQSVVEEGGTKYFLARSEADGTKLLGIEGIIEGFQGAQPAAGRALLFPLTASNITTLRGRLPWLRPETLGLKTSAGFGDRLGLATPGHVRSIRGLPATARTIAPIFAQQSVRENERTGRTAQQVLDDATCGLFQEAWREPWGADADHLKSPADADAFVAAGYTFYTIDPGEFVDGEVQGATRTDLETRIQSLPWGFLEDTRQDLERRYLGAALPGAAPEQVFDRELLWRAAAKYGRAIAHTVTMYRYIVDSLAHRRFELEVSVDETESPTSPAEHYYIASELHRLGVEWVSLAPRFVGRFEKGVDYIGDLAAFSAALERHAAMARELGPYKLSLHSGSDKFSLYDLVARQTAAGSAESIGSLVHLKTAGTSYLEALRAIAHVEGPLFREILLFARDCYETDRATYHVSAEAGKVPEPDSLEDDQLPATLDQFHTRQVLHVTFGSVLDQFGDRLTQALQRNEELYSSLLAGHFARHLRPFV